MARVLALAGSLTLHAALVGLTMVGALCRDAPLRAPVADDDGDWVAELRQPLPRKVTVELRAMRGDGGKPEAGGAFRTKRGGLENPAEHQKPVTQPRPPRRQAALQQPPVKGPAPPPENGQKTAAETETETAAETETETAAETETETAAETETETATETATEAETERLTDNGRKPCPAVGDRARDPGTDRDCAGHGAGASTGIGNGAAAAGDGRGGNGAGIGNGNGTGNGNRAARVAAVTPRPKRVSLARPARLIYPTRTGDERAGRTFHVRLTVDADGYVVGVQMRGGPSGRRGERAADAVWRFRYDPARDDDGRKIRSVVEQPFILLD